MGYCRIHGEYSKYESGCPECREAEERSSTALSEIADRLGELAGRDEPTYNPDFGEFECPHCRYRALRRRASRCPLCHGAINPEYWGAIAAAELERRRRAAEAAERAAEAAEKERQAAAAARKVREERDRVETAAAVVRYRQAAKRGLALLILAVVSIAAGNTWWRSHRAAAMRATLTRVVSVGEPYFGAERGRGEWPFAVTFEQYNAGSGTFTGRMDYYPKSDRAVLAIAGEIGDEGMAFWHTGVIREGASKANFRYDLVPRSGSLIGSYRALAGSSASGRVEIALDEDSRQAGAARVAAVERRLADEKASRTPTRVISQIQGNSDSEGLITLTDTDLTYTAYKSKETISLGIITHWQLDRGYGGCRIWLKGPSRMGGDFARALYSADYAACEKFGTEVAAARMAWKKKYAYLREE